MWFRLVDSQSEVPCWLLLTALMLQNGLGQRRSALISHAAGYISSCRPNTLGSTKSRCGGKPDALSGALLHERCAALLSKHAQGNTSYFVALL